MKIEYRKPWIGILAFIVVLFTMPLGHAAMIIMEKAFGHEYVFIAAGVMGFAGLFLLVWGVMVSSDTKATFLGLFAGLFIWTGWVEFAFVYFANRHGVQPLMENSEIITKPEYLIMPSSVGFWAILMIYYFLGSPTGCVFFNWFQKRLNIKNQQQFVPTQRNKAITTFIELIALLWTFYLVLLFAYDDRFLGDRHWVTYLVAFGSLFWSMFLFKNLLHISQMGYALRYSIPTVIIFWNFVEVLGRWNLFNEIWIEPGKYWLEMLLMALAFLVTLVFAALHRKKKIRLQKI